jgi:NAD-dependent deacetylase
MDNTVHIPDSLLQQFRQAQHVVVLTGAGISAESGVPTFRDAQTGLWKRFKPEELASLEAFRRDSRLVWEWYAWRRELVSRAAPNAGHLALVELEKRFPAFTLITQNVDGLHQRAGSGVRFPVIELHVNIQRTKCLEDGQLVDSWEEIGEVPPRCPRCAGLLRPDVVWFGELLPTEALNAAFTAAAGCDMFLSVGTSGLVEPAALLPLRALAAHIPVVEINLNPTPLSNLATYLLPGPSGQILPALVRAIWEA